MSARLRSGVVVVALGLALAAGAALAQAPDFEQGDQGQQRPDRPGGEQARAGWEVMRSMAELLGTEGAEVANTQDGVDVTITAEGDEALTNLQTTAAELVTKLQDMVALAQDAQADQRRQRRGGGLYGPLLAGKVELSAANIDDGVVLSFTTDDAEQVQQLQQDMAQSLERSAQRRQMMAAAERRTNIMALLNNDAVVIETADADGGITIAITSDDAELAAQIQELLKDYFDGVKAEAQRRQEMMERWRQRGGGRRGGW